MTEEPCTKESLVALVPQYNRYEVDENGVPGDWYDHGDPDHGGDILYVEEYLCNECGEFFTPDKRYDYDSLVKAWKAALEHLAA